MQRADELVSRLRELDRARSELGRVRELFHSEPDLLKLYEPSARHVVDRLKEEIWQDLATTFELGPAADAWVTLRAAHEDQKLQSSVVAKYLDRLVVANQHAVSVLENAPYRGGRFRSGIRSTADFEIAAVLPGSTRIALRAPGSWTGAEEVSYGVDQGTLFPTDNPSESRWPEALSRRQQALSGLKLLARCFRAVDSPELLKQLQKEFPTRRVLELLHYLRRLTPTSRSPYRSVEFSGEALQDELSDDGVLLVTETTYGHIDDVVARLSESQQYAEERGIMRAVDLDRKKVTLRRIPGSRPELPCELPLDFPEEELERLLNKPVVVTGWFILPSPHSEPSKMEVESVSILGADEDDERD